MYVLSVGFFVGFLLTAMVIFTLRVLRWRTTFARVPYAKRRLRNWAAPRGIALHEVKVSRFGADPFPMEGYQDGLIFRILVTDAQAVVRRGWAYVPDSNVAAMTHVQWMTEEPGGSAKGSSAESLPRSPDELPPAVRGD